MVVQKGGLGFLSTSFFESSLISFVVLCREGCVGLVDRGFGIERGVCLFGGSIRS